MLAATLGVELSSSGVNLVSARVFSALKAHWRSRRQQPLEPGWWDLANCFLLLCQLTM
jgi:hypothetical protein